MSANPIPEQAPLWAKCLVVVGFLAVISPMVWALQALV